MRHRHIFTQIIASLKSSPVVLLVGPKRIEKTTIALAAAAEFGIRSYLDLDDPRSSADVRRNPKQVLNSGPVLVSAIERSPGLLKELALVK